MGKNCKKCMDGAPDYYCCLLICGELEVCRYCDWPHRRVVTRCPMEEKEKMNKILKMGESKRHQNEQLDMLFELKFKPIVSEMCTFEEIERYFSQKCPGDIIQGTLGNQFGVRYVSHTSESVKVQLVFDEFSTKPNFDDYKLVMIPFMYNGKPQTIAFIQFCLLESSASACADKEKMNTTLEMGNGNKKHYMTFKEHIEKIRGCHEKNIHEKCHRCSKGIMMNANTFLKNTPKPVAPELVDITDTDFEWIEELDDDTRIKMYRKLCDLGVPYLV